MDKRLTKAQFITGFNKILTANNVASADLLTSNDVSDNYVSVDGKLFVTAMNKLIAAKNGTAIDLNKYGSSIDNSLTDEIFDDVMTYYSTIAGTSSGGSGSSDSGSAAAVMQFVQCQAPITGTSNTNNVTFDSLGTYTMPTPVINSTTGEYETDWSSIEGAVVSFKSIGVVSSPEVTTDNHAAEVTLRTAYQNDTIVTTGTNNLNTYLGEIEGICSMCGVTCTETANYVSTGCNGQMIIPTSAVTSEMGSSVAKANQPYALFPVRTVSCTIDPDGASAAYTGTSTFTANVCVPVVYVCDKLSNSVYESLRENSWWSLDATNLVYQGEDFLAWLNWAMTNLSGS